LTKFAISVEASRKGWVNPGDNAEETAHADGVVPSPAIKAVMQDYVLFAGYGKNAASALEYLLRGDHKYQPTRSLTVNAKSHHNIAAMLSKMFSLSESLLEDAMAGILVNCVAKGFPALHWDAGEFREGNSPNQRPRELRIFAERESQDQARREHFYWSNGIACWAFGLFWSNASSHYRWNE
jgi:hypothetical protein